MEEYEVVDVEHNAEQYEVVEVEQTFDAPSEELQEHNLAVEENDPEEVPDDAPLQQEEQPNEEEQYPEGDTVPQEKVHEEDPGAEVVDKKWPGWPGESVFRMLVPAQKVGGIIGRKGEFIKKIVEETRARVKILDGPPGTAERAVMVSAKEEPDSPLPPVMDGLLRVHKRLIDGSEGEGNPLRGTSGKISTRLLAAATQAGSLIGKQGATVKAIQEESNCIVRVLGSEDLPVFALQDDRVVEIIGEASGVHKGIELILSHLRKFLVDRSVIPLFEIQVMVSAKEEPDSPLPPAMDGLLRVHKRLIDGSEGEGNPLRGTSGKISTRLLVAATQAGSLIGKQGATVKAIQEESNCIVRVLGSEDLPVFALQDDRVVEIVGEASGVHKGIKLILSHLRKFLVDRSVIPLFEIQMQMAKAPPVDHHMPHHQHWGPPQGPPPPGPGYGHNPQYMPPPRQLDNYYPPPEMPPADLQTHQGISAYGREAPIGGHAPSSGQSAPSMIKQLTQQMQIPLSFADAVIGNAGSSISYIRRTSGATVTIQETRGVPNEMTVEISGTASQVQTAQQLIQNFMAEAAAPAPQQPGPPMDQGYGTQAYSSYQAHGSVYASPPSNPPGGYGSVYGSNYGY